MDRAPPLTQGKVAGSNPARGIPQKGRTDGAPLLSWYCRECVRQSAAPSVAGLRAQLDHFAKLPHFLGERDDRERLKERGVGHVGLPEIRRAHGAHPLEQLVEQRFHARTLPLPRLTRAARSPERPGELRLRSTVMDRTDRTMPQRALAQRALARARPDWAEPFLAALALSANVTVSARSVEVSRSTAYEARNRDDEFALEWDNAIEEALDGIELAVMQAARSGEDMATSRWVLARRRPSVWGDRAKAELSGSVAFDLDADQELLERLTRLAEVAQEEEDAELAAAFEAGKAAALEEQAAA